MNNLAMNGQSAPRPRSSVSEEKPSPADHPKNVANSVVKTLGVLHDFTSAQTALTVREPLLLLTSTAARHSA